jgi:transcriptional regulator with XRE-family HTH domain
MPPSFDPEAFGRRLKAALVLAEMTASELAAEVGDDLQISVATIERIMQGKRAPKPWEIERFALATRVPESFLRDGLLVSPRGLSGPEVEESVLPRLESVAAQLEEAATAIVQALAAEPSPRDSSQAAQDG